MSDNGKERRMAYIPVGDIRESQAALRKVNRTSEKYLQLVDSIRNVGVLKPILVHETADKDTGKTVYGLSDGLHRFYASQDAGLKEIPCHIVPLEESEVLATQIMANVHVIETKRAEYATSLIRLLATHPTWTTSDLCAMLNKSPLWVTNILSLTNLEQPYQDLVNENKINVVNAYALAKLPAEEQANFIERAMTDSPDVFTPTVQARVNEIKDAARKGREAGTEQFTPPAHVKKLGDLKQELASQMVGNAFLEKGIINDVASFQMGVMFALHLDPMSIAQAKEAWDARKRSNEEKRQQSDKEKNRKKELTARETLAKMGVVLPPDAKTEQVLALASK